MICSSGVVCCAENAVPSDQAKDFIRACLVHDTDERPTALQALDHPWLQGLHEAQASAPLASGVVARMQRFGRLCVTLRAENAVPRMSFA